MKRKNVTDIMSLQRIITVFRARESLFFLFFRPNVQPLPFILLQQGSRTHRDARSSPDAKQRKLRNNNSIREQWRETHAARTAMEKRGGHDLSLSLSLSFYLSLSLCNAEVL